MVILLEMLSLNPPQIIPKITLLLILKPLISRYRTIRVIKLMHQLRVLVLNLLAFQCGVADACHLLGEHLIGLPLHFGLAVVDVEETCGLEVF